MVQSLLALSAVRGCPSVGRSLLGWRVVMIVLAGFFGWCAARSLRAHLDRRGGCACCAGVPVRGSPGMGGAAFGGFLVVLGSCPAGGHRFPESHWRPLGAQSMSVSKLCGSLCSGARGSEVGGEQCKQST